MFNFNLKELVVFAILLTLIDTVWIRLFMRQKYNNWFNTINVNMSINLFSIFLAYSVMILIYPTLIANISSLKEKLIKAGIIGFAVFALYGFTLAGIFPHYGIDFAFTEAIWGTFLYTSVTFLTHIISRFL